MTRKTTDERIIEKAVMTTHAIERLVNEGKLYYAKDVEVLKNRIAELEAEVARLEAERPMPDHENIRGKEYYK